MKVLVFLLLIFFCFSCSYKNKNEKRVNADTITPEILIVKDTTIIFSIEEVSAEGSEVKARYIDGVISGARWQIYGETGQSVIIYKFEKNGTIKVDQKNYRYTTDLTGVKSDKDIHLKDSVTYSLDSSGTVLSAPGDESFSVIFKEFKKNIPMRLSDLSKYE